MLVLLHGFATGFDDGSRARATASGYGAKTIVIAPTRQDDDVRPPAEMILPNGTFPSVSPQGPSRPTEHRPAVPGARSATGAPPRGSVGGAVYGDGWPLTPARLRAPHPARPRRAPPGTTRTKGHGLACASWSPSCRHRRRAARGAPPGANGDDVTQDKQLKRKARQLAAETGQSYQSALYQLDPDRAATAAAAQARPPAVFTSSRVPMSNLPKPR
jgi:hypothetical protein